MKSPIHRKPWEFLWEADNAPGGSNKPDANLESGRAERVTPNKTKRAPKEPAFSTKPVQGVFLGFAPVVVAGKEKPEAHSATKKPWEFSWDNQSTNLNTITPTRAEKTPAPLGTNKKNSEAPIAAKSTTNNNDVQRMAGYETKIKTLLGKIIELEKMVKKLQGDEQKATELATKAITEKDAMKRSLFEMRELYEAGKQEKEGLRAELAKTQKALFEAEKQLATPVDDSTNIDANKVFAGFGVSEARAGREKAPQKTFITTIRHVNGKKTPMRVEVVAAPVAHNMASNGRSGARQAGYLSPFRANPEKILLSAESMNARGEDGEKDEAPIRIREREYA